MVAITTAAAQALVVPQRTTSVNRPFQAALVASSRISASQSGERLRMQTSTMAAIPTRASNRESSALSSAKSSARLEVQRQRPAVISQLFGFTMPDRNRIMGVTAA